MYKDLIHGQSIAGSESHLP